MLNESFKDTYVDLNGTVRRFDAKTKLQTENEVIIKRLAPLCVGEKKHAVARICFLPLGEAERTRIEKTFGNVFEDKEDAYLVEVASDAVTVYSNY